MLFILLYLYFYLSHTYTLGFYQETFIVSIRDFDYDRIRFSILFYTVFLSCFTRLVIMGVTLR